MMQEVLNVKDMLDRNISAPNHKNMPDAASHMCWLRALRERIVKPMEKLRSTIPELLNNNDVSRIGSQDLFGCSHSPSLFLLNYF